MATMSSVQPALLRIVDGSIDRQIASAVAVNGKRKCLTFEEGVDADPLRSGCYDEPAAEGRHRRVRLPLDARPASPPPASPSTGSRTARCAHVPARRGALAEHTRTSLLSPPCNRLGRTAEAVGPRLRTDTDACVDPQCTRHDAVPLHRAPRSVSRREDGEPARGVRPGCLAQSPDGSRPLRCWPFRPVKVSEANGPPRPRGAALVLTTHLGPDQNKSRHDR